MLLLAQTADDVRRQMESDNAWRAPVFWFGLIGLVLGLLGLVIRSAIRSSRATNFTAQPYSRPAGVPRAQSLNFDDQISPPSTVAPDGPGRYLITGVDRATKMDTTWHVEAQSAANAKAKAELEGIIVTDVQLD